MAPRKSRPDVPTFACINKARMEPGVDFDRLIPALQVFLDDCFVPIWGTPARLVKATKPQPGAWTMAFFDTPDDPSAEGYHDILKNGLPLAKVFIKPTLDNKDKVSVTACHELCETLVDPNINLWSVGPRGVFWAYEVCDAVEEEEFLVDGVSMSDFVFPAYFEAFRKPNSTQFDYLKKVTRPFHLLKGGYSEVRHGRRSKDVFGSRDKQRRFAKEDRRFHRNELRRHRTRTP
ncbi:MAG TPA: hypothetical protein VGH49_01015 [Xanthobacteraceae bacterium]